MRSLENRVRANLKCHFGGLAIVIPEPQSAAAGKHASKANPKAPDFDIEAARKASSETIAELAYNRYGTGTAVQVESQQPPPITSRTQDALLKARQKIFDTLKASPEIAEVSDLYPDNRYKSSVALGAFAPIYFVYRATAKVPPPQEAEKKASAKRYYFAYNGMFLVVAAFGEPDAGVPALPEVFSEACLLISKSGYEFRWLSPTPTIRSIDLGGTSPVSSSMAAALNDSDGRMATATSVFVRTPKSVQDSLRSVYAVSFQYLMAFYSLKQQADTQAALLQTVEAHRNAVLDLMHEFNQTKGRQFLRRRKLRRLVRAHCLNLTEKIGRADIISDSLAQGINSLEVGLQQEPELRVVLDREPGWKSYLQNDFDTRPVLDMIARTSDVISRPDVGFIVFWVALLAAAAGAVVGTLVGRIL